ncbi:MAG: hypothetical protein C3F13_10375 [Anaerolineales bacterium]|nr:MAG: hypothetical protein C3F13_10375 [Anaerolineales bacterium]
MPKSITKTLWNFFGLVLVFSLLAGCNFPGLSSITSDESQTSNGSEIQPSEVTFTASLPQPLQAGDSVYLNVLDEVTGLSFNPQKYIMQADSSLSYSVTLPLTVGRVIKYRYSREGVTSVNEHLYNDRPVRYRLYNVQGPGSVQDVISRWTDTETTGPSGRIMGKVQDLTTGKGIGNILVTAGGEQSFSLADGSFLLEGLPPGTHTLVFYALDGAYQIFQQGAVVAADSTTPVVIHLRPTKLVTVIFTVRVPANTPPGANIRLAGNLTQMGNTFADLSGGVSTLASRMPNLGKLADGRYMLTLFLPSDTYIEYKYTLGDGLWSSERTTGGEFKLRTLNVPGSELQQDDVIDTWLAPGGRPIQFNVGVPANTPESESVSIQFNPGFGWLEPLTMQPVIGTQGPPEWQFTLMGPFNNQTSLHYRYCRQEQCDAADDSSTMGPNAIGREINPKTNPGMIKDSVTSWAWLSDSYQQAEVPGLQVTARGGDFVAGLAFQPMFHPSYNPLLGSSIKDTQVSGVNWLVLRPTWTFTNNTPPILEPLPSHDMLQPELVMAINEAHTANLHVALFPQANFPAGYNQWWLDSARDYPWWVSFFERYSSFVLHHAAVAEASGASGLILGGDWLNPAIPGGLVPDGSSSNVPQDIEIRWRELVQNVRATFTGKLAWVVSYPDGVINPPPFLDAFDQVYILWSAPLATQPGTPIEQMQAQAGTLLDEQILPFQQIIGKPVILAISYPSIDQAATGCIALSDGGCLSYELLAQPNPDISAVGLNLQEQARVYNAMLGAINERSWIAGFVAMGYYPPALLQDKSTSIHGKPASGVLLYWSQGFLGK